MADYTLHCFAQSGNAYKAALMLAVCDVSWEPIFVDFFHGATRTPEYRALNTMGEVPVLEHRGLRLSQSGVILDYLAESLGRFGPASPGERREVLRWTLWDNHKLTSYIGTLRFLLNFAPPGKRDPAVIAFLEARTRSNLAILETHLATRDWIAADRPTTADLSCVGYLFFTDEFPFDPATHPALLRWRDRIAALPGWRHPYDLMPGHPIPAA